MVNADLPDVIEIQTPTSRRLINLWVLPPLTSMVDTGKGLERLASIL
jgi:hypothetical protein